MVVFVFQCFPFNLCLPHLPPLCPTNLFSMSVSPFFPCSHHPQLFQNPRREIVTGSTFSPFICHEVMGPDAVILVFLILTFKPAFSLTSSIPIKRLFSSSLLSAIRMISSVYLMLLLFLLEILIPACEESNPTFLMMHSAYKLNKQGDDIQPCHTLFLILNQSVVLCKVLIVSS